MVDSRNDQFTVIKEMNLTLDKRSIISKSIFNTNIRPCSRPDALISSYWSFLSSRAC